MKLVRLFLQILLPLLVLAGGALGARWIASKAKPPKVVAAAFEAPIVRVVAATPGEHRLDVEAQGTVEPFRTVDLTTQVGGRIAATNAALRAGGTCRAGDVLLTIDDTDLRLAISQQEAAVARAELRLLQERAEADAAVRAWRQLEGEREPEALVARAPQIRDAETALVAARAALEKSRLDLQRCQVLAPVGGRVRSADANVGQTVQPGQRLGVLLDTSCLEVRLPIPLNEAEFLDLPYTGERDGNGPADVVLRARFAGQPRQWPARVVRIEGELDRRTRQLTVVARVNAADAEGDRDGGADGHAPLLIGTFVQATLHGRSWRDVVVLPRSALRSDGSAWLVTPRLVAVDRLLHYHRPSLRRRPLDVLRVGSDHVVVRAGLAAGELVCVSRLDTAVDGMFVRLRRE